MNSTPATAPTLILPYCPRPMGCLFTMARAAGLVCLVGVLLMVAWTFLPIR